MAYKRVNWENLPSTKTPVNADNLNKMEEIYVGKEKPVAGEKVWFRKGKNLFDKSKALTGYWIIDEQGNIGQAGDTIFVTDFIPVFKDVPVYIPATGSARREFYNKNKVGTTYLNNAGAQVFTPTEDGFIRVTCNINAMDSLMIYYGTTETEYEAYIEPQIFVKNSNGAYEEIANAVEKTGDTMTGDLNMQGNSVKFSTNGNILFKEDGYGDKFRIISDFSGAGSSNKIKIQSTIGDVGTDPTNWKDLVYIHADTGEINLIDILTCNRIRTNKIDLNNGAFAPRCFQLQWGTTLIANTEVGGHGLIMVGQDVLYMFWIAGTNHDQLNVRTIWGDSNYCQVTMTDNAHLKVTSTNGDNMTCSILFIGGN